MSEEKAEPLSVYQLMSVSLEQFVEIAWQKLGYRPDPLTSQVHQDLDEARVAIDAAGYFAQILDPELDDVDRRRVQSLLSDLRINYVKKVDESKST
jgi:hypothetical protein